MRKTKTKLILALLMCILYTTALTPKVGASGVSIGEFPVSINLGDSLGYEDKEFEIELKPEHPNNPMPEGSIDGVYTIYITGANTASFPKIDYSEVGTYTYTISPKFDGDEADEYDTKTFLLKVQVTRSPITNLLQAMSTMYVLGQDSKVAGAVFYNAPPPLPTEPTEVPTEAPTKPPEESVKGETYTPPIDRPRTGDKTSIWLYVMLFTSGIGMIALLGLSTVSKNRKMLKD